ncbi:hypothetical protein BCR33DRAFT_851815 [Rhizoclosmatium globosum]|uniref:C2H2-type domain-containing protein n=1 Tax=Rhizoclosmatium globosum TaxID=329046 RepID=A0A1Y2C5J1_9FUNG|nr:hypothetical protein BCR33DRAFT_851815 [Rhizoclosmatium globosum]|eukprot:ORY42310.1 hypothetical protein BCR33DRAFT_851815 [Rhizoclosmatium globosum]
MRHHDLKRHIHTMHRPPDAPLIQCDICNQTFRRLDALRKHQKGRCKGKTGSVDD